MPYNSSDRQESKIKRIAFLLKELKNNDFTGNLTIYFSQGGIARIEKHESLKI